VAAPGRPPPRGHHTRAAGRRDPAVGVRVRREAWLRPLPGRVRDAERAVPEAAPPCVARRGARTGRGPVGREGLPGRVRRTAPRRHPTPPREGRDERRGVAHRLVRGALLVRLRRQQGRSGREPVPEPHPRRRRCLVPDLVRAEASRRTLQRGDACSAPAPGPVASPQPRARAAPGRAARRPRRRGALHRREGTAAHLFPGLLGTSRPGADPARDGAVRWGGRGGPERRPPRRHPPRHRRQPGRTPAACPAQPRRSVEQDRDGLLRAAITAVLEHAKATGATAVAVEDLDFADSKSREKFGRRKAFRHTIHGFPTTQFKDRIVAMAATQCLAVVAVDPRYTSRYGGASWQRALSSPTILATRHEGASVAIGRRALGHGLTTRTGRTAGSGRSRQRPVPHQSDGNTSPAGVQGRATADTTEAATRAGAHQPPAHVRQPSRRPSRSSGVVTLGGLSEQVTAGHRFPGDPPTR
jgi:IS605 OrfB family transposase